MTVLQQDNARLHDVPQRNKYAPQKSEQSPLLVQTWESLGTTAPHIFLPYESLPPAHAFPWAATVSHHLLAGSQIDALFKEIAERRTVRTFFIISPSHWNLSTKTWSLADCTWSVGCNRVICTETTALKTIAQTLGVSYDARVFPAEHGINTLIPYVARYFPEARVVAIAVQGEPPVNQLDAQKLTNALAPYFSEQLRKENFLLISTDFSHLADLPTTAKKDAVSRMFFDAPSSAAWIYAICDNRQGMYVLAHLLTSESKCNVLFHTNSYELSGEGSDNVTSYYFALFDS
ncbi:MAG: AmmeMemoRadiSam system protein B [Treponema sp.]|nr:AmmeMemoRadiSam system protein B [Treponema sp.]